MTFASQVTIMTIGTVATLTLFVMIVVEWLRHNRKVAHVFSAYSGLDRINVEKISMQQYSLDENVIANELLADTRKEDSYLTTAPAPITVKSYKHYDTIRDQVKAAKRLKDLKQAEVNYIVGVPAFLQEAANDKQAA